MYPQSGSKAKQQKRLGTKQPSLFERIDIPVKVIGGVLAAIVAVLTISEKARNIALSWFGKEQPAVVKTIPAPQNNLVNLSKTQKAQLERHDALSTSDQNSHFENSPEQYENISLLRKKDIKQVAILVWQEQEHDARTSEFSEVESKLAGSIMKHGMQPIQSFFTPRFIRENQAQNFFAGDWTIASRLQLERHVDYVLIGYGNVSYTSNPEIDGLFTANLHMELKCLDVVKRIVSESRSFAAPGAGYTKNDALDTAINHIQSQLDSFLSGIH